MTRSILTRTLRLLLPLSGLIPALLPAAATAGDPGPADTFSGEIELMLDRALPRQADDATGPSLFLHLERSGGQWRRVWGKGYTISEHMGLVDAAEIDDRQVRLRLRMLILGDFWIKGRWPAEFDITLRRDDDGRLEGTYTGTYAGRDVAGQVTGQVLPPRRQVDGFQPPRPDERPRLLFRKSDIPRLRAKLETPLGKAYRARVDSGGDMINLGVLYQLTGDRAYADRAAKAVSAAWRDDEGKIPVFGFGSGGFGHDIFTAAVTYDLCADAWPADLNDWMRSQLREFTELQQQILMTSHANFHPCSNYYGPGRGVPGVVSMALWGEPSPPPSPPRNPLERAWRVAPPNDYQPAEGAPLAALRAGKVPAEWIWTGLLPHECSRDVLSRIGGYAKARPTAGTTAEYVVRSETWFKPALVEFKPLPAKAVTDEGIDLDALSPDAGPSTSVYFTNVRVDEPMTVRPAGLGDDTQMWLSGVQLEPDRFYDIRPGVHPLTVEHRTRVTSGRVRPIVHRADPNADTGPLALYRLDHDLWQLDHRQWQRTGVDPVLQLWLDRGWFQNYQHYRWGIGDGGFFAETGGYAKIASWYPSVYASMYPHVFGREVSAHPDVDHVMPRQIMQTVFATPGRPSAVKLNSALTLTPQWMACHFPIIPAEYKGSALWAWDQLLGIDGPDGLPEAVARQKGRDRLAGLTLAQTFINYPLPPEPVEPAEGMPLTWAAETFGFYVFRSGWGSDDAFVAQVFAKGSPVGGWNHPSAAGFTVRGLGQVWTDAPTDRNGAREQYSVVLLPEDKINAGSCGRVVHRDLRPDGSGSVTIDLGDVYAARSRGLYDSMFNRHPDRRRPSGIDGLRAMGFDYSGRSGAPAVLAMVDRITGSGKRLWTWQRAGGQVEVHEDGFTIRQGEATMRATFITPRPVHVEAPGPVRVEVGKARHGFHGTVNRITAEGEGSFFVVCTFQRGPAPAVRVEGKGLDATVTIGGRIVRFDGTRIVFDQ